MTSKPTPQIVQGTAVALNGRAILLIGSPGVGKSELAMALIEQGAQFVADDLVHLCALGDKIMANMVQGRQHQMSLREIGLVDMEQAVSPVPLALVIELAPVTSLEQWTHFGPRLLDTYGPIDGLYCPQLTLDPRSQIILSKVRLALERWGH
ncbi:MAG: aldolase [Pseudomonadota bacterium]